MTAHRARPLFLFAPGAGAGIDSAWMKAWRDRLGTLGAVEAFDYAYRLAGRGRPDRPEQLIATHREAWQQARARHGETSPLFFIGKSMGSRIGCHLAVEEPEAARGLICFGYPLRGQNGKLRDEVLRALRVPVLFVQGTRDPLCPLDELRALLPALPVAHELLVIEGGDHSLAVPRPRRKKLNARDAAAPQSQTAGEPEDPQVLADARILAAVGDFVARRSVGAR